MKWLLIAAALSLLPACATTPQPQPDTQPVKIVDVFVCERPVPALVDTSLASVIEVAATNASRLNRCADTLDKLKQGVSPYVVFIH